MKTTGQYFTLLSKKGEGIKVSSLSLAFDGLIQVMARVGVLSLLVIRTNPRICLATISSVRGSFYFLFLISLVGYFLERVEGVAS